MAQKIYHKPAFNWWVKSVLKKRSRIISLVMKRNAEYLNKIYKFEIAVLKSVTQAYALDKKNGNTLWADSISKEMKDVSHAFKKLESG